MERLLRYSGSKLLKIQSVVIRASTGIIGVDIKSHQETQGWCDPDGKGAKPSPTIWAANRAADNGCDEAREQPIPRDVRVPTGGPFVFYMSEGRMWTTGTSTTIRKLVCKQARSEWAERPVQGKLATMVAEDGDAGLYGPTMDPKAFTEVYVPHPWRWALQPEVDSTGPDLSAMHWRMGSAIGGGWTER